MTTGQRIRMESRNLGRVEGRTEGRTEGRADTLLRLMQRRFGPLDQGRIAQVRAATIAELDLWTDRLLDAPSSDDVFAGS